MSFHKRWLEAGESRDAEAMIALLHEDYTFVRHKSGTTMNKAQTAEMFRGFMSSDSVKIIQQICLYENDEVVVEHSVMDFADGTRESIINFMKLKDGLAIRSETGATIVEK